ncbi:hypothetical protein ACFL27_12720 [candidate division CSSED10-310 bacterium]|uniref:PH domain-containing protein n=1 Tax=candidate division CSSED10-310 bacterium TaxID=2855610 RepID=A0ABV6YXW7_UNCC1
MAVGKRVQVAQAISMTGEDNHSEQSNQEIIIQWRAHPVSDNWKKSILVLLFIILLLFGVHFVSDGDPLLTILAILLLFGTLSPYFLVTEYRLDETYITQKRGSLILKKKWTEFRNFHVGDTLIQLSPFEYPSRLESFRSMSLLVNKSNRDQVLHMVQQRISKPEDQDNDSASDRVEADETGIMD